MLYLALLCSIFIFSCVSVKLPKEEKGVFLYKIHNETGLNLPYRLLYSSKKAKKYPLFIFLHGSGERGNDNEKQLVHGSEWIKNNLNGDYPAIAIVPQCPSNDFWSNVKISTNAEGARRFDFTYNEAPTESMKALVSLIESYAKLPYVDKDRIYVSGLSMGGMATFEIMWRMKGQIAAAAPICGGASLEAVKDMGMTQGIWIFHGDKDEVVLPKYSQEMNKALSSVNPSTRYSEYKGVGHDSWNNVFKEKNFFSWMFAHTLKSNTN